MRFPPKSLRNRLTLVLAIGSAILVSALVVGFNVFLWNQSHADLDRGLADRASAALSDIEVAGGSVKVREAPNDQALDQQVWVFAHNRPVERPVAAPAADRAAAELARRPGGYRDVPGADLRLHSVSVVHHGARVGTVVAGASVAPYETTAKHALVASIVLGLIIVAGVLIAVRLAIHAALEPVDLMTAEAAGWSIEDVDRRFAPLDTDDELARLASTFNDLLARLGASLRHERSFSTDVSHELRTPLAKLIMEADLALRRERTTEDYRAAVARMRADALEMQSVVETLLAVARSELDARRGTADAYTVAASVVESLAPVRDDIEVEIYRVGSAIRVGVDDSLAERVLSPVVANALKFARQSTNITIERADGAVRYIVRDDGPGVSQAEREAIFTPGYRGAPVDSDDSAGTGLGLALARRLAVAADGNVTCESRGGGGRFVVTLPAA
jgi:signal transduction histidine kinase